MLIWEKNRILRLGENENAIMSEEASVSYTLKSDDVTKEKDISETSPYIGKKEYFDEFGKAKNTCSSIVVTPVIDGLKINLKSNSKRLSEFGINLPFNFMGKKNGGGWKKQFLFNSPYSSENNKFIYCFLSNPSGQNLVIIVSGIADGWKMDYSPYVGGHFFYNLKLLANFDRVYGTSSENKTLTFFVYECKNFNQALGFVANTYKRPVMICDKHSGKIGDYINIKSFGACDSFFDGIKFYDLENGVANYRISREGEIKIIPFYKGKAGLECTVYGYKSLSELYKKSMDTVSESDIAVTDGNLCEHQCWAAAMLRYMLKYGRNKEYECKVKRLLGIITETDESKAIPRITIFDKSQKNGLPAYHIYKSTRIQEQFFGITILSDAYRYFKEKKYLDYAINSMNTMLDVYQKSDGRLETFVEWSGEYCDYSTVCCLIIPIIDLAKLVYKHNLLLYEKYINAASRLAEYLYNRGLVFPTETELNENTELEMEDGSISCTALSLLYYCDNVEYNESYLHKAEEILNIHDAWVVQTPFAQTHGSTLRWWETRWEGDADGPALCMGHAWTIWRAEADYLMWKFTKDEKWHIKAMNGFGTNFAKINSRGESFSIFQVDYITGGGFNDRANRTYNIAKKFPNQTDSGLSRYVWVRAADTILK